MAEELSSDSWGNALVLRVAGRIRDTRREQGYSVRELSERTQRLGHHVTRQVLVNLESGRRGVVSVQDLFVIAHALGVNPLFLVFDHLQMGRPVEVLPGLLVPEWMALQWARSVPTSISSALYEEDFDSARGIIAARERLDVLESDIRAIENRIGTLAHPEDSERAAEMRGTLAAHLAHRDSLRAILDRDGVQANAAWFDGGTLSQYRSTIWEPADSDG